MDLHQVKYVRELDIQKQLNISRPGTKTGSWEILSLLLFNSRDNIFFYKSDKG